MTLETQMQAKFRIIRLLEDNLVASDCIITTTIDIIPSEHATRIKDRIKAMKIWTEGYLDGCVAFGTGTLVNTEMLENISNNLMMCPDDPHDYLLLVLIHSKLMAFGGNEIMVLKTTLVTDTGEGFINSVEGSTEDWLPSMSEWIGPRSFHSMPWWCRDDSSTIDLLPEQDDDLSVLPPLGMSMEEMVSVTSRKDVNAQDSAKEAEIIKPSFKPRIITPDD